MWFGLTCTQKYFLICFSRQTRTKTSIRYAKEGEKERERKKDRRRDIEREGDIERERERGERDKESEREPVLSKPNSSTNAFPKLCGWFSGRFLLKGRGTIPSLRVKSSWNLPNRDLKRKERLITKIMTQELWAEIITGNYQLVYIITRKMW